MDGRYVYCFSNEHWSANTKEVSFNVHGIVYVPESEAPQDPLEQEVRFLAGMLAQVKDEQTYIVVRERTHRNTAESTNSRVKWWSTFQLGVLIGEGIFQVWWLKRFFEVPVFLICFSSTGVNVLYRSSTSSKSRPSYMSPLGSFYNYTQKHLIRVNENMSRILFSIAFSPKVN
jgi:hypothetical protein